MNLESCFPRAAGSPVAYSFPNNGVVLDRLPNSLYDALMVEAERIKSDFESQHKVNDTLVGHMQKQYNFKFAIPLLNDYIVDLAQKHTAFFNVPILPEVSNSKTIRADYHLENLWINFQRKYEFNPVHVHTGAYSFVIWLKIPYELEDEKKVFADMNPEDRAPSNFNFFVTDILGKIHDHTVNVDKSREGCIVLFPASLSHSVNPFYTSDEYRISISGNVYLRLSGV